MVLVAVERLRGEGVPAPGRTCCRCMLLLLVAHPDYHLRSHYLILLLQLLLGADQRTEET